MANKGYLKRKRQLLDPYSVIGFSFRHSLYQTEPFTGDSNTVPGKWHVDLWLNFIWSGAAVMIHSNTDELDKAFEAYYNKLLKLKNICERSLDHLLTGKGPKVARDFLNDEKDNDGFGATLFITCDPDDKNNYCVFEISSCYKKFRYGMNPKEMTKYLKKVLSFMEMVFADLDIVKSKIEENKADVQRLLQEPGKAESSDS